MYEKIAADTMMEKVHSDFYLLRKSNNIETLLGCLTWVVLCRRPQEPWRYNAYLKRLLQRVGDGGLTPINMCLASIASSVALHALGCTLSNPTIIAASNGCEERRRTRHIYEGMEKGVAALQFLQRANNIGKVVISSPSRFLA